MKRVEPREFLDAWFGAYVCYISIKIYCGFINQTYFRGSYGVFAIHLGVINLLLIRVQGRVTLDPWAW